MTNHESDARKLAATFDLEKLTPEFYANPYPTYRALREHEPVKRLPNGSWFLTRYDDLIAPTRTPSFFFRQEEGVRAEIRPSLLYEHHTTSLVFNDPPAHTRVRRRSWARCRRARSRRMEPDLIALVDRLLDGIAAKGNSTRSTISPQRSRSR